jgi:hypothetical protein
MGIEEIKNYVWWICHTTRVYGCGGGLLCYFVLKEAGGRDGQADEMGWERWIEN